MKSTLDKQQTKELLQTIQNRFKLNMVRHQDIVWKEVQIRLESQSEKLLSLYQMEQTGGEPDIVSLNSLGEEIVFIDCSPESPNRRSLCYDQTALEARKKHKPASSAMQIAKEMGIEILTESQYFELQERGEFDLKTSSWLQTPPDVRERGGAIFGDRRFGRVFIYHNGADSYYASRGFRGLLKI